MSYFDYNGIKLYYEKAGDGPPLFMVNGLGGDTRVWSFLSPYLNKSFTTIAYDMRCAGKSDEPADPFTISDLSDEAYALIDHLDLKKVSVLGFSMGGMVAQDLALNYADRIDKLILVSTMPATMHMYPIPDFIIKLFVKTDVSPKLIALVYDAIFGSSFKKIHSAQEFIDFKMNDKTPQPIEAYLNQFNAIKSFDVRDIVSNISAPTLVVAGDEDRVIPPKNAQWLNEHISGSKIAIFDKVGHMLPIECPEKLSNLVRELCL